MPSLGLAEAVDRFERGTVLHVERGGLWHPAAVIATGEAEYWVERLFVALVDDRLAPLASWLDTRAIDERLGFSDDIRYDGAAVDIATLLTQRGLRATVGLERLIGPLGGDRGGHFGFDWGQVRNDEEIVYRVSQYLCRNETCRHPGHEGRGCRSCACRG